MYIDTEGAGMGCKVEEGAGEGENRFKGGSAAGKSARN